MSVFQLMSMSDEEQVCQYRRWPELTGFSPVSHTFSYSKLNSLICLPIYFLEISDDSFTPAVIFSKVH